MRNSKIAYKIPKSRQSFKPGTNELIISVADGEVVGFIRNGEVNRSQQSTEWYFVDEGINDFGLFYDVGNINFHFFLSCRVVCPTIVIGSEQLLKNKTEDVISEWAKSSGVLNVITKFLQKKGIDSEKKLFEGNGCTLLEKELMLFCREDFITKFGMLLEKVEIIEKKSFEAKKAEDIDDKYSFLI